jgi:hypothetical protein
MRVLAVSRKITVAEMRGTSVRGLLVHRNDFRCSRWTAISADQWPDDARLIWNPGSPVRPVAGAVRRFGPTGTRLKAMPEGAIAKKRRRPR